MGRFETMKDLEQWLRKQNIDTSQWGQGAAKTVADLWTELVNEEMQLQENPPLRVIEVVRVIIQRGDKMLIEGEQIFGNKQRRYRGMPPSEKMRPDETALTGAIRCLQEELQIASTDIRFRSSIPIIDEEIKESPSYPQLKTLYRFHTLQVEIDTLPQQDSFWTVEQSHSVNTSDKQHQWLWVKP